MTKIQEKTVLNFHLYPAVGEEDWRYAFACAQVKTLETFMLSKGVLQDMANAADFEDALDLLSASEYSSLQGKNLEQINEILLEKRGDVRNLFFSLVIDRGIAELLEARSDFANLRLALRRKLTEKPIDTDYCQDGFVNAEEFEDIFEQENYSPLPIYMREAIEAAVLAYYQNKDVRQIDYALDAEYFRYSIEKAIELNLVTQLKEESAEAVALVAKLNLFEKEDKKMADEKKPETQEPQSGVSDVELQVNALNASLAEVQKLFTERLDNLEKKLEAITDSVKEVAKEAKLKPLSPEEIDKTNEKPKTNLQRYIEKALNK